MAGATAVFSIGDTVGGNATLILTYSVTIASGAGRAYPTTEAGGALAWADRNCRPKTDVDEYWCYYRW